MAAANDSETELVVHDPGQRVYRKLVRRQGRVATARILAETIGIDAEAEMVAVARRANAMRQDFRLWHHSNAVLMAVLLLTGVALHFPATRPVLLGFEWSDNLTGTVAYNRGIRQATQYLGNAGWA